MPESVRMELDHGGILEFHNLFWTPAGRLFCKVIGYAPDGSIIGNSKLEMSSSADRFRISREFAAHNGAVPDTWADALLGAWHSLDTAHQDESEKFLLMPLESRAEPGPLEFVWHPLMPVGFPSNVYGDGGASKSTTMMGLAVAIALGQPFLGMPTLKGNVLYLDWELDEQTFLRRLYAICRGMGQECPPADLYYAKLTESLDYHLPSIMEQCHRLDPALVIVDSLGPAAAADPNDAKAFIRIMQQLRKLERASVVVDHQSKTSAQSYHTKRAIGSGYKDFLVRGGIQLELAENVPGRSSIVLRHSKHNFTYAHEPVGFHIRYGTGIIEFEVGDITEAGFAESELLPVPLRILKNLEESAHATPADTLGEITGCSKGGLKNAIGKLRRQGHRIRTIKGANNSNSYFLEP
jgi:hypothetical protein